MIYLRGGLLLILLVGVLTAQGTTASRGYLELVKEYNGALEAFEKLARDAKTPEAKRQVFREAYPQPSVWAPRFMEFHRRYPTSRQAVDALIWVVTHPVEQTAREFTLRARALELLRTHYLEDERVGKLCTGLVFTIDQPSEDFLRHVFSKAPAAGTQARACASLAHNFKYRARLIDALNEDADMRKEYEKTYGKPILAALLKQDADKLIGESKKLFQYVSAKHGGMKHPTHGTLAKLAEAHLASLEKPVQLDEPAPEIDAVDAEGKPLKLSDHKGKVVLLDFWGNGFPSSREMYDYERGLGKRLAGKPFVILGVNADPDREALKKLRGSEKLTWRTWWDGGNVGGPIATRWEVDHWPTLFLIDHKGIVRHISLGWPERKAADELIDKLVAEAVKGK